MTKPRFSFHTIFAREPSGLAGVSRSVIGDHDTPSADSVVLPASTPSFLIDEDPFADLSHGLCSQRNLPEDSPLQSLSSTSAIVHLPPRTSVLVGSTQARPAFKRPAISSRPSLPSLSTLSHMKIGASFPQVRNGHVGAGLPAEPWDLVRVTSGSPISANDTNSITAIPTPSSCEPTSPLTRTDESKAISTSPSDNPMTLSIAPHSVPPLRPITKLRTTSASVRFFDAPPSPNKEHTPAEKFEMLTVECPGRPVYCLTSVSPSSSQSETHQIVAQKIIPIVSPSPRSLPTSIDTLHPLLSVEPLPVLREIASPEPLSFPVKNREPSTKPEDIDEDLDLEDTLHLDRLGLDFGYLREEVGPALARNLSKSLSAGRRAASSRVVVLPTPADKNVLPRLDTSCSSARISTSSRSSSWQRRLFRTTSLVGDVLHFAPPRSPARPSALALADALGKSLAEQRPESFEQSYSSPSSSELQSRCSTPALTPDTSPASSWSGHDCPSASDSDLHAGTHVHIVAQSTPRQTRVFRLW